MAVLDGHRLRMQIDHPLRAADRCFQRRLRQQPVHEQREMVTHQTRKKITGGRPGKEGGYAAGEDGQSTLKSQSQSQCSEPLVLSTKNRAPGGRGSFEGWIRGGVKARRGLGWIGGGVKGRKRWSALECNAAMEGRPSQGKRQNKPSLPLSLGPDLN